MSHTKMQRYTLQYVGSLQRLQLVLHCVKFDGLHDVLHLEEGFNDAVTEGDLDSALDVKGVGIHILLHGRHSLEQALSLRSVGVWGVAILALLQQI